MSYTDTAADTSFSLPEPAGLHDPDLSPSAAAVRSALLSGLSTVEDFAAALNKSKRTVDQWIADGLPIVRVGRTPYVAVADARAWLLKPSARKPEARKPGRPRKAA